MLPYRRVSFCSNGRQIPHMHNSSCPLPSVFLVIFSLIAWFDRMPNDTSRTGWPMIMQWIVEALNECTNWELECEPKTLIMAGWMYRWGQQHGIQQWNGHHISYVCVLEQEGMGLGGGLQLLSLSMLTDRDQQPALKTSTNNPYI